MSVLEVEHLTKAYGSTVAVDDVSFPVPGGEVFGILGPNGSGKTTTVECMGGLYTVPVNRSVDARPPSGQSGGSSGRAAAVAGQPMCPLLPRCDSEGTQQQGP